MFSFKNRFGRLTLALGLVGVLSAGILVPAVGAADPVATASVTAGTLSQTPSGAPSFRATLDGSDQAPTDSSMTIDVNDATGSGSGWNLTITSTEFSSGSHTLDTGAMTVTGVSSSCAQGTCSALTNSIDYAAFTVPAGATAPTAIKLYNAAVDTGMGDFTVTPTFKVSIPAKTYAGTYSSTITLSIQSAP